MSFEERYERQIRLKGFGLESQKKLSNAKVLIVGAGGLGCPALQYLTAAGVGTIGLIDNDNVELSNLHRQILFSTNDIGKPKVEIAISKMKSLNPEIDFKKYFIRLLPENAIEIITEYDIVIDGSDNFETKYLVNDVCVFLDKPLVYGAVQAFEGQVSVFNYGENKINYRDLYPTPPKVGVSMSCSEIGVLGVLPGMIGTMQAVEVIKIITGIGKIFSNSILFYNALQNSFYEFDISKREGNIYPSTGEEILNHDYGFSCPANSGVNEISTEEFNEFISNGRAAIIDIREYSESPEINGFEYLKIPMSEIEQSIEDIPTHKKLIFFCNSGVRSITAAEVVLKKFPDADVSSLKNGIVIWMISKK